MRRHQGARSRSRAMEEKANPVYEWSGWRKKGTQTISLISLSNLANKISLVGVTIKAAPCHEKK